MASKERAASTIHVKGANEHNLQNVSLKIPHGKLSALTGVSGAGKTTLAHNVIAQVARRRLGRLLGDARFLKPSYEPNVDEILGLPPCIEVLQEPLHGQSRSTVATYSGLLDLIATLFLGYGETRTPEGEIAQQIDEKNIGEWLWRNFRGSKIAVCSIRSEVAVTSIRNLPEDTFYYRERHSNWITGSRSALRNILPTKISLAEQKMAGVLKAPSDIDRFVCAASERLWVIENDLYVEEGFNRIALGDPKPFPPRSKRIYSFNSVGPGGGRCPVCDGLGEVEAVSENRIVGNPDLPILKGGLALPNSKGRFTHLGVLDDILRGILFESGVRLDVSWNELPNDVRKVILSGSNGRAIGELQIGDSKPRSAKRPFRGLLSLIFEKAKSPGPAGKIFLSWIEKSVCDECEGSRFRRTSRLEQWRDLNFGKVFSNYRVSDLLKALSIVQLPKGGKEAGIVASLIDLLSAFDDLNLGHLPLSRATSTLSGGEGQRLKLGLSLALSVSGACYILDEPSRGLHYSDLIGIRRILRKLISNGNTALMVEHHPALIEEADHVILMGPGGGSAGGKVTFEGLPTALPTTEMASPEHQGRKVDADRLEVSGLSLNNLKNVSFGIPKRSLTAVVGVSGSGKSSAIFRGMIPALESHWAGATGIKSCRLKVPSGVNFVEIVGQKLTSHNRRSIVATVLEIFDDLRKYYAALPEARALSLDSKHFSFNSEGACEQCGGTGYSLDGFGEETEARCHSCGGSRYSGFPLMVRSQGQGIADLLDFPVVDLLSISHPALRGRPSSVLEVLIDLGLGHLSLGRDTPSLSAGERQRLALARFLARVEDRARPGLLILDEPTAGLGVAAAQRVFEKLQELTIDFAHTVVVVEHKLELIPIADWVLEFGPRGGPQGGEVVFEGSPIELLKLDTETAKALRRRSTHKRTASKRTSPPLYFGETQWKDCCAAFEPLATRRVTHDEAKAAHPIKPAIRFSSDRIPEDVRIGELLDLLPWLRSTVKPDRQVGVRHHSSLSDLEESIVGTPFGFSPVAPQLRLGLAAPCDLKPALKNLQKLGFERASVNGNLAPLARVAAADLGLPLLKSLYVICEADASLPLRKAAFRWSEGVVALSPASASMVIHSTQFIDLATSAIGESINSKFVGDSRSIRGQCRQCRGSGALPVYPWDLIVNNEKQGISSDSFWVPEVLSGIRALRRSRIVPEAKFFAQQKVADFELPPKEMDPRTRLLFEHGIGWRRFLKPSARRADREQDFYSWRGIHDYVYLALGKIKSKKHKTMLKDGFLLESCPVCKGTGMGWEAGCLSSNGASMMDIWSEWPLSRWKTQLSCKVPALLSALEVGAGRLTAADRFGSLPATLKEALLFALIPTAQLDSLALVSRDTSTLTFDSRKIVKRYHMNLIEES